MKHALLIFAVAIGAASLTRAEGPGTAADEAYSKNGCSIVFPKGWTLNTVAGATAFVFAHAPSPDVSAGQEQTATMNIARMPQGKDDLMTLAKDTQSRQLKDMQAQNYRVAEPPAELNIGGAKAVVFGATYTGHNKSLRNRQWLIAAPGRVYVVTLTALSASWDKRASTGDASVATFRAVDEKR